MLRGFSWDRVASCVCVSLFDSPARTVLSVVRLDTLFYPPLYLIFQPRFELTGWSLSPTLYLSPSQFPKEVRLILLIAR